MESLLAAAYTLGDTGLPWNITNLLAISIGDRDQLDHLFYGFENPDSPVINISNLKKLTEGIHLLTSHYLGYIVGRYGSMSLRLESLGLIKDVDFVYDDQVFVKVNNLEKIEKSLKSAIIQYYPANQQQSMLNSYTGKMGKCLSTYLDMKERNKDNRLERILLSERNFNNKGMIIYRNPSKFIVSKNIESKLDELIEGLDSFTINYYEHFTGERDNSDIIMIQNIDNLDILKAMKLYR